MTFRPFHGLLCASALLSTTTHAMSEAEARVYCEEIHPPAYYEPEELRGYIERCVADYADGPAWDDSMADDSSWNSAESETAAEQQRFSEPRAEDSNASEREAPPR